MTFSKALTVNLRKAVQAGQPHESTGANREGSEVEFSNFLLLRTTANYCHPSTLLWVSHMMSSKSNHWLLCSST